MIVLHAGRQSEFSLTNLSHVRSLITINETDRVSQVSLVNLALYKMGLCLTTIYFKEGIPAFDTIKSQFYKQTGYGLWVGAELNLFQLGSPVEISQALQSDLEKVIDIKRECAQLEQTHPTDHDKRARVAHQLRSLTCIPSVYFDTMFYQITFWVKPGQLIIESYNGQFYAVESLIKILIELGGAFESNDGLNRRRKEWKRLKPWDEYKWYNRPRK